MICAVTNQEVEPDDGPTDDTIQCPACGQVLDEATLDPIQEDQ